MKTLISEHDDYRVYIEIDKSSDYDDKYKVKFTSTFSGAKNPEGEHVKLEMFLNESELQKLKAAF